MQGMAHAGFLGVHVVEIVRIGVNLYRHILDHLETITLKPDALDRVVGHQAHLTDSQQVENLRTDAIIAFVGAMTEMDVCLHRVKAFLLQLVSADFIHQAYAPAFLTEIEYATAPFGLYHLHCLVELFTAVAPL